MRTPPPLDLNPTFAGLGSWKTSFPGGVRLSVSTDPAGQTLQDFYEGYDQSFVLEAEKEGLTGFQTCLRLNADPDYAALAQRFGPFREVVLTLHHADGQLIAGANLAAFAPLGAQPPSITVNLNYIYVLPTFRGQGWFRRLVDLIAERVTDLFEKSAPVSIFLEQNDPFDLSPEDYARDSEHTGLDQFDRLRIWQGLGARLLRFSYEQPPLSTDQEGAQGLLYGMLRPMGPTLPACLLQQHLKAFFGISVLKGRDPGTDPVAGPQLASLDQMCRQGGQIDLLDPGPLLDSLAKGQPIPAAQSLLDVLPPRAGPQKEPS